MARGRQKGIVSLKDTVKDSEIIRNGEVKNAPNYPFPDGQYGISGEYHDYSLVKKRIAYRTGTEDDGEYNGKVIEYYTWEDVPCYCSTIEGIFESYAQILNLTEFKRKKMKGDIGKLVAIHQRTNDMINEALKGYDTYLTKEQEETCKLLGTKLRLREEINEMREGLKEFKDLKTNAIAEIKEARTIIVDRDKPKKHRVKLEKE
jgi:hypothetical protein